MGRFTTLLLAMLAVPAAAQQPFYTDDFLVPEPGKWHFDFSMSSTHDTKGQSGSCLIDYWLMQLRKSR